MCIFAELYLGFVPFTISRGGGLVTFMVEILGPLPEEWKAYISTMKRPAVVGMALIPSHILNSYFRQSKHARIPNQTLLNDNIYFLS